MQIFDVSVPVSPRLPTWPGDPTISLTRASSIAAGDPANVSRLEAGVHTGTHVDAPVHFMDGAPGIDSISVQTLVGPCLVVAADPPGLELRPEDLPATDHTRILFKTRNSKRWGAGDQPFDTEFVAVGPELAARLVAEGKLLVGVDYLSVESYHAPFEHPVHHALLEARIVVVEGLDLSAVEPGEYQLYCLPLKLVGSDGAPARTILVRR
ncbi:MAG TPA: cyclase family protein [Candidatus Dormibacteraeota bacterium]|nr:cyclase family protein [Candidatus Dormibacteraeota bacterium]